MFTPERIYLTALCLTHTDCFVCMCHPVQRGHSYRKTQSNFTQQPFSASFHTSSFTSFLSHQDFFLFLTPLPSLPWLQFSLASCHFHSHLLFSPPERFCLFTYFIYRTQIIYKKRWLHCSEGRFLSLSLQLRSKQEEHSVAQMQENAVKESKYLQFYNWPKL